MHLTKQGMKTPFLKQVAAHYLEAGIQDTCFIFPNRRSAVFFRKYLGDLLRESGAGGPMLAPKCLTINDFFSRVYGTPVSERIRLLLALYESYCAVYPAHEPLDEFVFWGEIILADFDDIDKYLVDARDLYADVAGYKDIQDDYSHLSKTQRAAVERFVAHFRDRAGRLTVHLDTDKASVKARFLQIWTILYPLYRHFQASLADKKLAYEGMVYRHLAELLRGGTPIRDILEGVFPEAARFVVVGLNALNACEKTVLGKMRDAGLAEFVWDYSSAAIKDPANRSSFFMEENLQAFPPAFRPDPEGLDFPEVKVISVPSAVGQTKLAPNILSECEGDPVETAFVLPDENLLLPLLGAIPPEYASINITMGLPLTGGSIYTLMSAIAALQLHLREKDGRWFFYHRQIHTILTSSLFRSVLTPEEAAVAATVRKAAKYYIPQEDLQGGELLEMVFSPVVLQPKDPSAAQNHALAEALGRIISLIGWKMRGQEAWLLELDFAKRYLECLHLLDGIDLDVLPATWLRLLDDLLQGESVPFRGEPLEGLQVMGPLETRALDFRNLVILSAGEGSFPRRSVSASFVPPELRRGFGLPTYEYQDSVWAYYFYRMIQRADKVWLLYDSRTEGLKSGEESRFIKQLQYHFRVPMQRFVATAPMSLTPEKDEIPKTEADIEAIRGGELSASSLQNYLCCPAKFYYQFVQRLQTEEEVAESLDAGSMGTVFHAVMQSLYGPFKLVTPAAIEKMQADVPALKALVREKMLKEMQTIDISGRNLVVEEVILQYVLRTLAYDHKLLADKGSKGFQILGLERRMYCKFQGFTFKGFADRIDSYKAGEVRIVDYKTGKVEENDILITDDNALEVCEKLFGPTNRNRPKIALQLFLYGLLAQAYPDLKGRPVENAIYSIPRLSKDPFPDHPENAAFAMEVRERLKGLLAEMTDPSVPFRRTQERDSCALCDFKTICGR